jgi:hypothetical protein
MTERDNDREFSDLLAAVDRLPQSVEPPRDLWPGIEARIAGKRPGRRPGIRPGKGEGGKGKDWIRRLLVPLAAAAVLAVVLLGRRGTLQSEGVWEVTRLAGVPRVGATPLGAGGALRTGEWLETDDSSRAVILVGAIGHVEVKPGTRIRLVRARPTDHRLALDRGAIYAQVDAPPRLFFVETPAGTAVDLGCAYTLEVDSSGHGLIHVSGGYVEFDWSGRRSIVPLGFLAVTRPGVGPGVPYAADAPDALRRALEAHDFANGGAAAVRRALTAARPEDAVSVWHLLSRVDPVLRGVVYDRLAALVPPLAAVTRDGVLRLEPRQLDAYWTTIRRIAWRRVILQGIRDIDPRTGLSR